MPCIGRKVRQGGQRPRRHCIEKFERPVVFGASMFNLNILAPETECGLLHESGLLAGALDQRKVPRWIDDGERQAGKTRARADVGDPRAAQVGLQSQAVEDMLAQHPQTVAYGRQIELRVSGFQLIDELEQRLGAG